MSYARGAVYERDLMKRFEAKDFYVMRSAKSKGVFDLIAIPKFNPDASTCLIQVKSSRDKITARQIVDSVTMRKELAGLESFPNGEKNIKLVVIYQPGNAPIVKKERAKPVAKGKKKRPAPKATSSKPLIVSMFHVFTEFVMDTMPTARFVYKQIYLPGITTNEMQPATKQGRKVAS